MKMIKRFVPAVLLLTILGCHKETNYDRSWLDAQVAQHRKQVSDVDKMNLSPEEKKKKYAEIEKLMSDDRDKYMLQQKK